jgi:hypothetical protein
VATRGWREQSAGASSVAERLNGEFAGVARIETVRWETASYSAHANFQSQIPVRALGLPLCRTLLQGYLRLAAIAPGSQPGSFHLGFALCRLRASPLCRLRVSPMWTMLGFAVVVFIAFALFVLLYEMSKRHE